MLNEFWKQQFFKIAKNIAYTVLTHTLNIQIHMPHAFHKY